MTTTTASPAAPLSDRKQAGRQVPMTPPLVRAAPKRPAKTSIPLARRLRTHPERVGTECPPATHIADTRRYCGWFEVAMIDNTRMGI